MNTVSFEFELVFVTLVAALAIAIGLVLSGYVSTLSLRMGKQFAALGDLSKAISTAFIFSVLVFFLYLLMNSNGMFRSSRHFDIELFAKWLVACLIAASFATVHSKLNFKFAILASFGAALGFGALSQLHTERLVSRNQCKTLTLTESEGISRLIDRLNHRESPKLCEIVSKSNDTSTGYLVRTITRGTFIYLTANPLYSGAPLEGVAAHELGHYVNSDYERNALLRALLWISCFVLGTGISRIFRRVNRGSEPSIRVMGDTLVCLGLICFAFLINATNGKLEEGRADEFAINSGFGSQLRIALQLSPEADDVGRILGKLSYESYYDRKQRIDRHSRIVVGKPTTD